MTGIGVNWADVPAALPEVMPGRMFLSAVEGCVETSQVLLEILRQ